MISFELFKSRLEKIQHFDCEVDSRIEKFLESHPFLSDASGVRAPFLADEIIEHLITLFYAVNDSLPEDQMREFVEWYFLENNYAGEVTVKEKSYHLDYEEELYDYIKGMTNKG